MSAEHDALLARIAADPADDDAWAVLKDWLLANDDPRGAVWAARDADLPGLLETHGPIWFGRPIAVEGRGQIVAREDLTDTWSPGVHAHFERGHIEALMVETTWNGQRPGWGEDWIPGLLRHLLARPVARLIQRVELRSTPYSEFRYEGLVEALASGAPLAIRELYAGDGDQVSWTNVPDLSAIWRAAPWLERVHCEGSNITLGDCSHPRLRTLKLESGGLPTEPVHAITNADLPALCDLELWFGDEEYGAECDVDDVRPLLQKPLPALRRIGLVNCAFSDALVEPLMRAVWLPQITTLALHGSILTDTGAQVLLDHAKTTLAHIEHLDVHESYLSDGMARKLAAAFPSVDTSGQKEADDWGDDELYYYVALGE
jgi:hypothetical protein